MVVTKSEFAQLQHRRKFSQSRFEKMVLECTVQAARMEVDVHQRQWSESWSVCHEFEKGEDTECVEPSELISGRKSALENAMSWRLRGDLSKCIYIVEGRLFHGQPTFIISVITQVGCLVDV